ncbi:nucleoside triphosphate pyrophosphohydrolase family protein [Humibacillus xanthopallidus]|uniref:NTP pyrophosphatase (Non-canonical NTP hydrolase) n=1 Tax=Humibacillus xanthopallidus TaxID=412689 RepID=A0A543HHR6_9MICO|nr:nucleoside triphosphate pyrophosphohydrolase family protein [Humibacillus xanthopallidus]TQM57854.1 NTP pyrophosphatase (non-canonical NTP hydrolase) [Humibacillus xanthopallidus]
MDLRDFQQKALGTDQRDRADGEDALVVHLLGLAGEAGSVASEYKKHLRDGEAHAFWKARMRLELGDVLWYVAAVANDLGLDLNEIATANLEKTKARWQLTTCDQLDANYPPGERLPRRGVVDLVVGQRDDGSDVVRMMVDGVQIGSDLTDASAVDDGYRYHDVFHLAFATLLGWSPVTRALMGRKRRSNPVVDEQEDGGRAVAIEEGLSAAVFAYAAQHDYLEGVERLDQSLLLQVEQLTGQMEVGVRTPAQWEHAILTAFTVWRRVRAAGRGRIVFDADAGTFKFEPTPADGGL